MKKDLIIIGGGPAGLTAGIYAKRAELDLVVLDSGIGGGQIANAGLVENYPGFPNGIRGMELAERFREHAEKTGVKIKALEPVTALEKEGRLFTASTEKQSYSAKAVIVATGLEHRKLGVPGEEELTGRGVSYCATCDGAFYKGRRVAVVGGGTGAAMAALNLADLASKVYVVTRREALKVAEKIIETRLRKAGNIELIPSSKVRSIKGEDKVEALEIERPGARELLDVEGVFIEVGRKPRTAFLKSLVELKKGFVVADEKQATSMPGLFAAGDVVHGSVKQLSVAVAQGAVAALSAYEYIKSSF